MCQAKISRLNEFYLVDLNYCKILNAHSPIFTDEIQAHTQKVTDLDIGATGRVLVTGKLVLLLI